MGEAGRISEYERDEAAGRRASRSAVAARLAVAAAVDAVESTLRQCGSRAALGLLNARTRFRFTGVYRVDAPLLRNVDLFDRENPTVNVSGAVCRLDETYCSLTAAIGSAFTTGDAARDPRLVSHAARDSVIAYAGVPLRLRGGEVWGTLCHFDVRPRLVPDGELAVLEAAAPVFASWLAGRAAAGRSPAGA